jgi:hypothetical protein
VGGREMWQFQRPTARPPPAAAPGPAQQRRPQSAWLSAENRCFTPVLRYESSASRLRHAQRALCEGRTGERSFHH